MSDPWIPVSQAAKQLNLSVSTIRRRIKTGQLSARTNESGHSEVQIPQDDATALSGQSSPLPEAFETDKGETTENQDELLQQFERLAGGSIMLAQQRSDEAHAHADEAHEQLALTRRQLHQMRKLCVISWSAMALISALGIILTTAFGVSANRAQTQAIVYQTSANEAQVQTTELHHELGRQLNQASKLYDQIEAQNAHVGRLQQTLTQYQQPDAHSSRMSSVPTE